MFVVKKIILYFYHSKPDIYTKLNSKWYMFVFCRHWMFGERTSSDGSNARGWFPSSCLVEISSCPEDKDEYLYSRSNNIKKAQWAFSVFWLFLLNWVDRKDISHNLSERLLLLSSHKSSVIRFLLTFLCKPHTVFMFFNQKEVQEVQSKPTN